MYNNLLEAQGEECIWNGNNLLFRNREAEARDMLGSPIGLEEFGAGKTSFTLGFTGYMYDDISDTYFAQAREYMPEVGRFAGRDIVKGTILQPLTLNNYNYCYSNPNKYVDWDGMTPVRGLWREFNRIKMVMNSNVDMTYSTGITTSVAFSGIGKSMSLGYAVDSEGNIGITFSSSDRVGLANESLFAGKYVSFSTADNIIRLEGPSNHDFEIGYGQVIEGLPLAGSLEVSEFGYEKKYYSGTANYGVGIPGLSILYGNSETQFVQIQGRKTINIKELLHMLGPGKNNSLD